MFVPGREGQPLRSCESRFCGIVGPFTDRPIFTTVGWSAEIVGWCDVCRRRVCARCALQTLVQDAGRNEERKLACRRCGEPLGMGGDPLLLDHGIGQDGSETHSRVLSFEGQAWLSLLRKLIRTRSFQSAKAKSTGSASQGTLSTSARYQGVDPDNAVLRNLSYQQALRQWKDLPWWKRLVVARPEPPTGI